ncbi:MAG: hypothetical protein AB1705_15365 [Verrucomicrobiota bacterium]
MKPIRQTISLPEDLSEYAETRAAEIAAMTGDKPNLSAYMRALIVQERRKLGAAKGKRGVKREAVAA